MSAQTSERTGRQDLVWDCNSSIVLLERPTSPDKKRKVRTNIHTAAQMRSALQSVISRDFISDSGAARRKLIVTTSWTQAKAAPRRRTATDQLRESARRNAGPLRIPALLEWRLSEKSARVITLMRQHAPLDVLIAVLWFTGGYQSRLSWLRRKSAPPPELELTRNLVSTG
jgi:hypothetical protein